MVAADREVCRHGSILVRRAAHHLGLAADAEGEPAARAAPGGAERNQQAAAHRARLGVAARRGVTGSRALTGRLFDWHLIPLLVGHS
jgi:hypothetical protein